MINWKNNKTLYTVAGITLLSILTLGGITQINWYGQITNMPIIDARTYGVQCNGSTDDATALQAALDAVPTTIQSSGALTTPVEVRLPSGVCMIGSEVKIRRNGLTLSGFGNQQLVCNNSSCSATIQSASTVLTAVNTFNGPILTVKASNITSPTTSITISGIKIRDIGFDNTAAVNNGHYTGLPLINVLSATNSTFERLQFWGHVVGGLWVGLDTGSTNTSSLNPYPSEGIIVRDIFSKSSITTASTYSAIDFSGTNHSIVENAIIINGSSSSCGVIAGAAIELDSADYGAIGYGNTFSNVYSNGYCDFFKLTGTAQTKIQCSTPPGSGGCNLGSPNHSAPVSTHLYNSFVHGFNEGILIGNEPNVSGGPRRPAIDFHADKSNHYEQTIGSNPAIANVDWLNGGEISSGWAELENLQFGTNAIPIKLGQFSGASTNIISHVAYDPSGAGNAFTLPIVDTCTSGCNKVMVDVGSVQFSQLPTISTFGSIPINTVMVCQNCVCTAGSGSACTAGVTGQFRMVVWVGALGWLGL